MNIAGRGVCHALKSFFEMGNNEKSGNKISKSAVKNTKPGA